MELKPSEISALIKKQIENYDNQVVADDVGTIVKIGDGIAIIQGLGKAMASELLEFPNGVYGMVLNLEEDSIGAVLMGDDAILYSSILP